MQIGRRAFLKGIGITGLAAALGRPIYEPLLKQEYHLTLSLDERKLGKFIRVEITGYTSCREVIVNWSMRRGWINACVTVTDQHNRPWEIIGYFEELRSPEGWTFSLDRLDS